MKPNSLFLIIPERFMGLLYDYGCEKCRNAAHLMIFFLLPEEQNKNPPVWVDFFLIGHPFFGLIAACRNGNLNLAEDKSISHAADQNPHNNIDDRMLLEEDGGNADQEGGHAKEKPPGTVLEQLGFPGGVPYRHRADYMQGGTDIGVCVMLIESSHHLRQDIIPGKDGGAQQLNGREQIEKQQSYAVGDDDKPHELFKDGLIGEKCIQMDAHQIDKPEQVRN